MFGGVEGYVECARLLIAAGRSLDPLLSFSRLCVCGCVSRDPPHSNFPIRRSHKCQIPRWSAHTSALRSSEGACCLRAPSPREGSLLRNIHCASHAPAQGADVHAHDKFNSTPLRIAASNANTLESSGKCGSASDVRLRRVVSTFTERFLQVAEALISYGADINASSAAGNCSPTDSVTD